MTDEYVELHARSAFSFLEGACVPEELVKACADMNGPAMAILDKDGVYGSPRFHVAARKTGIQAHIGAEITVNFGTEDNPIRIPVPVLVQTREGYQNLCRLITRMKMRVPKNTECAATPEELAEHSRGLICLTGDRKGPLAYALHSGAWHESLEVPLTRRRDANPLVMAEWLQDTFGRENVYAELQRHLIREEEWRNHATIDLARRLNMPLLATHGVS